MKQGGMCPTKKEARLFVVSGVVFAIGILLCLVSFISAKVSGGSVFNQVQNEDGNYVFTYDFSGETVKKINIDVATADINIIGGSDSNRVELINFAQGQFRFTASATTLSLGEKSGLGDVFSFNFAGLRNVLHSVIFIGRNKTVNIYLTDTTALKLFDVELFCGDVSIKNCSANAKYNIKISYGDLLTENISTDDTLSVNISEGNFDASNGTFKNMRAEMKKGYVNIQGSKVTNTDINIQRGYFKYITGDYSLLSSVMRVQTDNGRVRFNNDIYENGKFSQGMKYSGISSVVQIIVNVHVADGNIMIAERE